jgi:hypothetical protein
MQVTEITGIARADKEARILIIPVIRSAKVGMSWVMCNLHRTWTFEKDGEILEQSKYPALESAKAQFPIPSHAFFRGYDVSVQCCHLHPLICRLLFTGTTLIKDIRRRLVEITRNGLPP